MNIRNKIDIRRYFLYVAILCLLALSLVSCGGGGGGSAGSDYTPPQPNVAVPHAILLSSDRTVGQSNAPIYMTALVTDVNGRPVQGTNVTFTKTSTAGNISPSLVNEFDFKDVAVYKVQTDNYGRASIKVNSTASGYVTVEAYTDSGLMARRSMLFVSSGTTVNQFTPISVVLDVDGNNNGVYNEADDYKVCQTTTDQTIRVRATVYFKGEKAAGIGLMLTTDLSQLVNFYNNIYGIYTVDPTTGARTLTGCDYNGDGVVDSVCFTPHTTISGVTSYWFSEDRVYTNSAGVASSEFTISCQTITQERLLSVMATTDSYSFPEFSSTAKYYGTGSTTLFMESIIVSSITVTANPTEVATGQTSYITASVNTTLGSATAPDGTFVQFSADCKDSVSTATSAFNPQTAQTFGGKATTIFTAPTQIPTGDTGQCTIQARVASVSGFVPLTVNRALEINPATQTLSDPNVGDTATYNVVGGAKPYSVRSSDPHVTVSISGSTVTATVASIPQDDTLNVSITVTDAKHTEVTATLVLASAPLTITPPSQSLTAPAVGTSVTYTVKGGKRPYQVYVDQPQIVSASISGSTVTVTTLVAITASNAKSVTITVMDNKGTTVNATLSLTTSSGMTITPPTQTLTSPPVGTTATYTISGGTAPYKVTVDKPQMVSVSVNGKTITVTTLVPITSANATSVTIYATDSSDASATATLSLSAAAGMTITPPTRTLTSPPVGTTATYTISGGVAPYSVTVDKTQMASVSVSGTTITVTTLVPITTSNATSVTIYATDSSNATATATLSLSVAAGMTITPPSQTLANPPVGATAKYTISGGVAPYNVTVDKTQMANVSVSGATITVTTLVPITTANATSITIYATDSSGGAATALLILNAATGALIIDPATQTLTAPAVGATVTYTIRGGTRPYTTSVNLPQTVSTSTTGDTLTVKTLVAITTATTVTINVTDTNGLTGTATLILNPSGANALTITPTTRVLTMPMKGTIATYTVSGGKTPYSVTTDHPQQVSASVVGSTITLTLLQDITSATTITFFVTDANGLTGNATLTTAAGTLSIFPATITLTSPNAGDTANYDIFGANPPFKVYVDRPDLVTATTGTSASASSSIPLTVTVRQKITASDNGTTVNIDVLDGNTNDGKCTLKFVVN
ncbi:MAG: hypothetical protein HQL03_06190 [Nitrospirae bacterium]|nr:hypothetical protein [Nitrospirota bacterium]MBF0591800.1 hypothetical protein [Nitrospirota bacterium]